VFTLMDQILLRMLPIHEPERLVQFDEQGPRFGSSRGDKASSYPMYRDLRDRSEVFDGIIGRYATSLALGYKGQTERASAELVSGNYFDVLGVKPRLGRTIAPEDDRKPGAHPVAVLSFAYWQRKFGGDANILNNTVLVNGHPMTIIGVTQPGFQGIAVGRASDLFLPIAMKTQATPTWDSLENRRDAWLQVFGRLKPGVSFEAAQASLAPLYKQILNAEVDTLPADKPELRERFLKEKKLVVGSAGKGISNLRQQFEKPLSVLMGMVGLVLLIACANVANLLTARAAARQKEIAIRVSLGASRWQIVKQLLVESTVLSVIGGMLALLVAVWTADILMSFLPFEEGPKPLSTTPDARVLAFNFATSILAAFLFGLVPAIQAARHAIADTLKAEANNISGGSAQVRFRKGLVVAQISLSLLLLIGAGLFARSLYNLRDMHPGFAVENLMTFSIDPSLNGYKGERGVNFFERSLQSLKAVPGVRLVSAADIALMTGDRSIYTLIVEGYTSKDREDMNSDLTHIAPSYFETLGVPLVAGREFTAADRLGSTPVCIINETLAKRFFPGQNALGRRLAWGRPKVFREVVGIVKDQRTETLRQAARRYVYAPMLQDDNPTGANVYIRTALSPATVAMSLRRQMQSLDSNVPLNDMKTMEVQVSESLFVERLVASLSAFFGLLATLLAAIGLYGVMAYTVARRTREIGIRVALGAERSGVIGLVMREVVMLAAIGIAIGLPIAVALSQYVRSQLFGLEANDPLTIGIATSVMAAVALAAGYIPAERAARVNPIIALRYE
jgi:predicted permease